MSEWEKVEIPCVCGNGTLQFDFRRGEHDSGGKLTRYYLEGEATCSSCGYKEEAIYSPSQLFLLAKIK